MRIFLNDLKISFIWKSVILNRNSYAHSRKSNNKRQENRTEPRVKKTERNHIAKADDAKFYVWWCTGDWWVSWRKIRCVPKPRTSTRNRTRTTQQTNHHGPLICDMWGEFPQVEKRQTEWEFSLWNGGCEGKENPNLSREIFEWFHCIWASFLAHGSLWYSMIYSIILVWLCYGHSSMYDSSLTKIEILSFW